MASPALAPAVRADPPEVWLFCGVPGDKAHYEKYALLLEKLGRTFSDRFGLSPERVRVWYDQAAIPDARGILTRERLAEECARIVRRSEAGAPVWLFFFGHSHRLRGDVQYNLPGPDITGRELRDLLAGASGKAPLVMFWATSSSDRYVRFLVGKRRVIVSATARIDKENEPDFPAALLRALETEETDANGDGLLSVTEIFRQTKLVGKAMYDSEKLIQTEHAALDGDGDGRATLRPSRRDAQGADGVGLRLRRLEPEFD